MSKSHLIKIGVSAALYLTLQGCASTQANVVDTDSGKVNFGSCDLNEPRVVTSNRQMIILEHRERQSKTAESYAISWCGDSNSSAQIERKTCDGCCRSAYQCR
jgi:hypothetical protein